MQMWFAERGKDNSAGSSSLSAALPSPAVHGMAGEPTIQPASQKNTLSPPCSRSCPAGHHPCRVPSPPSQLPPVLGEVGVNTRVPEGWEIFCPSEDSHPMMGIGHETPVSPHPSQAHGDTQRMHLYPHQISLNSPSTAPLNIQQ